MLNEGVRALIEKLNTIIVDDEPLARRLLKATLLELPCIDIIAECKNGREALEAAVQMSPDLMFLDIQMPGLSGIEVVNSLQADLMPMVIFTTAYDKYAIDAFRLHAVDYLLKPLEEDLVQQAVDRALQRKNRDEGPAARKQKLVAALDDVDKEAGQQHRSSNIENKKLAIKDGREIDMVEFDKIDWIDAAGDLMCIHSSGKTFLMRSTMKNLMTQLNPNQFKRIHRSTIINLDRIEKIVPHIKGEFFVYLDCAEKLKVSRGYKEVINEFLAR